MLFKRKGGWGGQRLFEQCSKNALFLRDGFPYHYIQDEYIPNGKMQRHGLVQQMEADASNALYLDIIMSFLNFT